MKRTELFFAAVAIAAATALAGVGTNALIERANADDTKPLVVEATNQATSLSRQPAAVTVVETEVVILSEHNSVVMDAVFNDNSCAAVMRELQNISDHMSKSGTIYLVLNSPGGSVDSGLKLIAFAKALPQKVKTLTIFAASMGFQTVQQLDERLVLPNGTLMSHPIRFAVDGDTPYQLIHRFEWIMSIADSMDQVAARRMGVSFAQYQALIHDELWAFGNNAVANRTADRVVLAACGEYKNKTKWVNVETMFGVFQVELSSCPLIPGFITVKAPQNTTPETLDYVRTMVSDRTRFTKLYITNGKYLKFQK